MCHLKYAIVVFLKQIKYNQILYNNIATHRDKIIHFVFKEPTVLVRVFQICLALWPAVYWRVYKIYLYK